MKKILFILLVVFPFGDLAAQVQKKPGGAQAKGPAAQASATTTPKSGDAIPEDFLIGVEDVLQISVWKEAELSLKVQVRPDGKISFPLINDLQAQGLTTKQLQEKVTEKLKEFLATPVVSVVILEIHSQVIFVMGQVAKPGVYPLGLPTTIVEMLAKAGGFTDVAKTKSIQVARKEGKNTVQYHFNYKDFLKGKNLQNNISLKNGDVVIVP